MEPPRPGPRPGALSDIEARLLAAAVGKRLFKRSAEPVQLGRYRVLERLGQGGMGVVFRAHDPELRRDVAIKLLHAARGEPDREQTARLRREAQALGRLSHPNVVQVYEIGEAEDHVFVAMELVRGTTLRAWLGERPRHLAEILAMTIQAGRGLAAAHAAGIVHRDLKPENVLVGDDGRARVVDFGLARAAREAAAPADASIAAPLTRTGTVLGTPAFMAPEQVTSPARADARSDQFSFCVMAYEALHGERPFDDLAAVAAGAVRPAPAGTKVPPDLRAAVLRGLRPDPAERWPSMDALLATLERAATDLRDVPAPPPRRRLLVLAALLVLVTLAALAVPWWQARARERDAAAHLVALRDRLAGLLADDDLPAAERALAGLVAASPDRRLAAAAWATWARLLSQTRAHSPRLAWAHAYALARDDADARRDALLGLADASSADPHAAGVLALIDAEAPELRDAPVLSAIRSRAREPDAPARERAAGHARRLADAGAPPEVVALARADLLDLADAALATLAAAADPPTRRAWQLAAAPLALDLGDDDRALALFAAAAAEPGLQDSAITQRVDLLLRRGDLAGAARVLDERLAAGDAGELAARRARLAAILDARADVPLRFTGPGADAWIDLDPAALHADLVQRTLLVDAEPGVLASWPLTLAADRLLVDLDLAPRSLPAASGLALRLAAASDAVDLVLRAADPLELRCGDASLAIDPRPAGALRLQLDLDVAAGRATCRLLDPDGRVRLQRDVPIAWHPGPARLELRGAGDPAAEPARLELSRLALVGARLDAAPQHSDLALAGAALVDGDVHGALLLLAAPSDPQARLLRALALARLGRLADAAAQLSQARTGDHDGALDPGLARWLRGDPRGLGPALRQTLGARAYLELFARAWSGPLDAAHASPELTRLVLAELDGLDAPCDGADPCAVLLRAYGRASLSIGEKDRARRALEAALAAAPHDPRGRALAGQILVDLALLKTPRRESD